MCGATLAFWADGSEGEYRKYSHFNELLPLVSIKTWNFNALRGVFRSELLTINDFWHGLYSDTPGVSGLTRRNAPEILLLETVMQAERDNIYV